MNHYEFENLLRNAPETSVKVSGQLHQDIMRSVRLAGPGKKRFGFEWAGPALGASMAALLLIALQVSQPVIETAPSPEVARVIDSPDKYKALGDSLKSLATGSLPTENDLQLEFERLKSDLKRFDFRS